MNSPKFKVGDVVRYQLVDPFYGVVKVISNTKGTWYSCKVLDSTDVSRIGEIEEWTLPKEYSELLPLYNSPLYLAMSESDDD